MNALDLKDDSSLRDFRLECRHKFHRPKSKTPAECEERINREWQQMVSALLEATSGGNHGNRATLYFQVALKFYDLNLPEYKIFLGKSAHANLQAHRETEGINRVSLRSESCCSECSRAGTRKISFSEAAQYALPNPSCTNEIGPAGPGWCTCEFLADFD